jgi:septal ring factor EnvC (AmiA/AmiB activator)
MQTVGEELSAWISPTRGTIVVGVGGLIITLGGFLMRNRPVTGSILVGTGILLDWVVFLSTAYEIQNTQENINQQQYEIRNVQDKIDTRRNEIEEIEENINSTKREIEEISDRVFAFSSGTNSESLETKVEKLRDDHEELKRRFDDFGEGMSRRI